MGKDLYQILGVKETASPEEIKRAYRDLAKKYHPDRTGGDKAKEARFKDVTAANEVLSDTQKRAQYDAMRRGEDRRFVDFDARGGGGGFGGGMPSSGGGAAGFGSLEDLLQQVFGQGGARVIFEQEFAPQAGRRRNGAHTQVHSAASSTPPAEQRVRGPSGAEFVRRGDDLHADVLVTIEEAVLGAKVEAATVDGRVTLTIPPGTSSGKQLRLRGKGLGPQGDLYITVQIAVPPEVDDRARELLREFSRRAPVKPRR